MRTRGGRRVRHSLIVSMKNMPLVQTVAPKIFRFSDIDAFRSSVRNLNVDFTPLTRTISAEQIVLNLPGCAVNCTKSFPRILDAQLDPNCTLIGFTMDDGVPIRFNGAEEENCAAIVIGSGGAVYTQVERAPRQYASIVFAPEVEGRGWAPSGTAFRIVATSGAALRALRGLTLKVTSLSSEFVDPLEFAEVSAAIRESLLAAVDNAFADGVPGHWRQTQPGNSRCSGMWKPPCQAILATRSIAAILQSRSVFPCARCTTRSSDIVE